ncbi:MAG: TIGR00282 family metallophosphoesterase [Magnetovibrio sp.]|nr:TIGR00282 family metallophosphoesterase [Magnetovibrio sp.]
MNILAIGDVVGRSGRDVLLKHLSELKIKLSLDFIIVNGENAAHGFGITPKICKIFYEAGVNVITTGNHVWDQREIVEYIDEDPSLIRPLNYPAGTPGSGFGVFETVDNRRILVVQVMGRLFMDPLDDPFAVLERVLKSYKLGTSVDAIVIDVHGEASSEKQAFGEIFDGQASAIFGTHTHVPTADHRILPGGTAFVTDLGMTGDYNSIIGMEKEVASSRFITKIPSGRLTPATGIGTLCGAFIQIDDVSGLAKRIQAVRIDGQLNLAYPEP